MLDFFLAPPNAVLSLKWLLTINITVIVIVIGLLIHYLFLALGSSLADS